jgi:hypothetical protein
MPLLPLWGQSLSGMYVCKYHHFSTVHQHAKGDLLDKDILQYKVKGYFFMR